jgi:glucokinase
MSETYWVGIDLGGTKILSGVFDDQLKLLARQKTRVGTDHAPEAVFARIVENVNALLAEAKLEIGQVRAIGLGVPGQVDPRSERVRFAPNLNWRDLDLAQFLPPTWHCAIHPENDVKVGTYGEYVCGAAQGGRIVLGIFAGTGVGGGLILDGELFHGFNFNAGEIGHTIIDWHTGTSLERVAGRRWLVQRAFEQLQDAPKRIRRNWRNLDPHKVKSSQLAELYEKDDPLGVQLIDEAARALAAAVASAVNLISPQIIVIGGGMAGSLGPSFLERVWEVAQRYILPGAAEGVRCVAAALGDDAGITGAAALARKRTLAHTNQPTGGHP